MIEQTSMTDSLTGFDRLTGLFSRYQAKELFANAMSSFYTSHCDFSIIILDVDSFNNVNETFGYQVGDKVLVDLANLIKENTRTTDFISRWDGEKFLIIAGESNLKDAFILAEKLRIIVQNHQFPVVGQVTVSCGVVQYIEDETNYNLVSRADKALYDAKKTGRNKVVKGKVVKLPFF